MRNQNINTNSVIESEKIINLKVVVNTRLKKNWYVTFVPLKNTRTLHLPQSLYYAPVNIQKLIIAWALLPLKNKRSKKNLSKKRLLEKSIKDYLTNIGVKYERRKFDVQKLSQNTQGNVYDLKELFDKINTKYFNNRIQSSMRWGNKNSTTSYQKEVIDQNGNKCNLITIAGIYNHPKVPRFAIESVIYHEMLHIVVPVYKKNGRNVIHGPEFKRLEQSFPYYKKWKLWQQNEVQELMSPRKKIFNYKLPNFLKL